jgi:hypothetical protein
MAEEQRRFLSDLKHQTDASIRAATTSAVQQIVATSTGETPVVKPLDAPRP